MIKIRKGDKVKVLAGKDRGKFGTIERLSPKQGVALVAGVNLFKKHLKPSKRTPDGGIIEISKPLPLSKLMLVCPKCGTPTRVRVRVEKGQSVRVCRRCGAVLS